MQFPFLTFSLARIGMMKAAVFPEPVGAQARTSRSYKKVEIAM